ncbi:MAG: DUF485 domain-containing protein [Rhodospirillaceae bacterium]|nr:DUF485 domain-containing protein [Rhodospirillaceae bacterium]
MGQQTLRGLAQARWRMAIALSAIMVVIYFGFILLIAFNKAALGALIVPGLSVGIVLGALVILLTWAVTWYYVRWANKNVDGHVARLGAES